MPLNLAITPVSAPTISGLAATATLKGVLLTWDALQDTTLFAVEIWASSTNDRATATLLTTVTSNYYLHTGLASGLTRYYWVRAKNTYGRTDGAWTPVSSTAGVSATTLMTQTADLNPNAATSVFVSQSIVPFSQTVYDTYQGVTRYTFPGTGNVHVTDLQHGSNFNVLTVGTAGEASSHQKFDVYEHTYYSAGTISVTNGSAVVTGSGTLWLANVAAGNTISMPNNGRYVIQSVDSNGQITLTTPYTGSTAAGQGYYIITATTTLTSVIFETARYKISGSYCLTFEYPFHFRIANPTVVGKLYDADLYWKLARTDASWSVSQDSVLRVLIDEQIKR